jgi:type I restriction enzyme S subunit
MAMSQTSYALIGKNGLSQFWVFLLTKDLVEVFKKKATGAVFDTIVVDTFRQQQIVQPKKEVIDTFHKEVEPIFALLKNLQKKNANLRRTRDLLLPRLVSGEVAVHE